MEFIREENIYDGYFGLSKIMVKDEDDKVYGFERIKSRDGVAGVVFNTYVGTYIFVKQFRPGPIDDVIECPAGLIDENHTPMDAIRKEIREEIGYKVDYIRQLGEPISTSPNLSGKI
jgi:ADP-ribose pyrophosphatase